MGTLFRKYDGANRYMEVVFLLHMLTFGMAVGLLQQDSQTQSLICFLLQAGLTVYCCTNPFNEYARFVFDLASHAFFSIALLVLVMYRYDMIGDMAGGLIIWFNIASMGCKIAFMA